jgi:uncharacterized protein YjeT (DUF2065 family)
VESTSDIVLAALALVLIVEGLTYALFPEGIKKMMAAALNAPSRTLQLLGLTAALTGVIIVWLIRQ